MLLSDDHRIMPYYRQRISIKDWRKVLINGENRLMYKGEMIVLKAKNIGFGIIEVYKDLNTDNTMQSVRSIAEMEAQLANCDSRIAELESQLADAQERNHVLQQLLDDEIARCDNVRLVLLRTIMGKEAD